MARLLGAIGVLLFGVAVAVSALAVRENQPRTSTSDDVAGAGAASAAPRIANMAPLRFGPGYAARSARISPDGELATAMTNDWAAGGLFTLSDDASSGFVTARGSAPPRVIASGMPSIVGGIQWDASGRVLYPNARTVVAVDLSGHQTTYSMSADASAFGVVGMSPDRSVAVIGVNVSTRESVRLLDGGSTRALPSGIAQPIVWVGPHEMLGRSDDGQLFAADARRKERALGVVMKSSDVRVLAYSAPYLLWIDNPPARV